MGHIKEPKGVDFIIQSRTLTKAEELALSEHIKNYKLKNNSLWQSQHLAKPLLNPCILTLSCKSARSRPNEKTHWENFTV